MNIPPYGDNYKRVGAYFSNLQVSARTAPNMSVKISAGGFWYYTSSGATYVEYVGGNSPTMTVPAGNAKWVIITIGQSGVISIVDGAISAHPVLPAVPGRGRIPLAAVYVQSGISSITNDMIYDIRPLFPLEIRDHRDLEGNSSAASHPISAISNLTETIEQLVTLDGLAVYLADKADKGGTIEPIFKLNSDYSGTPSTDCLLEVERGSEDNTAIKWNEGTHKWQYTDDGSTWINFGDLFLNTGTQELKLLTYTQATEPALAAVETLALWIDSDDANRVYLIYRRSAGTQVKIELT